MIHMDSLCRLAGIPHLSGKQMWYLSSSSTLQSYFLALKFNDITLIQSFKSLNASLPPYRNHSTDLLCRSIDLFLYEGRLKFNGLKLSNAYYEL